MISVYDRMCWPAGALERALCDGSHRRELSAYLGAGEYALLRTLARAAARRRRDRAALRVYLLPGIMGSQLGTHRADGAPPDLLWLDPTDIVHGRLSELRRGPGTHLATLGGVDYSYLALRLRLQAAGFEVVLFDYDWRQSLEEVALALAARLRADRRRRLALVGHSMGGLLARAALAQLAGERTDARIVHVIGLGTPHGGSIGAVQALRATYPVVLRLAAVDPRHDAAQLSERVFGTFPSIYQLLPPAVDGIDLFDAQQWPRRGPRPRPAPLAAARRFAARMAPAD